VCQALEMTTRRAFLAGSAAGVGLLVLGAPPARGSAPGQRPLLTGPYPRTFVFRQCEVLAQLRSYSDWAPPFLPFGAIMGKALPEERTDTVTDRNLHYFNRFKNEHPDKLVLLHYNGRGRLPGYRTGSWYAGDWLHFAGATATTAVAVDDTVLTVDDASRFSAPTDAFGNVGADLVLTARTSGGGPDWSRAEQLIVTAVDEGSGTLTVQRGQYGSTPLALPAGAYVAQHVTLGPWSAQDGRLWAYNLATIAPRGPDGFGAVDRIGAEMTADFARGGQLGRFDGIELDIFTFPVNSVDRPTVDGDGDGVGDGCIASGVDTFLDGEAALLAQLRVSVGPQRFVLTDGASGQRPDTATTNGIEEEGFADGTTPLAGWSTDLSALLFWQSGGHRPRFNYPLVKTGTGVGDPPNFPGVRVSIAAALLADTLLTFWDEPAGTSLDGLRLPPDSGVFVNRFSVWDELVGGPLDDPGWLGRPTGPAVWTATAGADLLDGAGVHLPRSWIDGLDLSGATATRTSGPALRLDATGSAGFSMAFVIADFAGGDLVIGASLLAAPSPGLPESVPQVVTVTIGPQRTRTINKHYVGGAYRAMRTYARGVPAGDVRVQWAFPTTPTAQLRSIRAYGAADAGYRVFDNGAVFVNPSLQPYTFDVSSLGSFVRLTATSGQDPSVNDGSAIGPTLTLPACDALLVRRAG
jgi:hypothetical protein